MKYDAEELALRFTDEREAAALRAQLSDLMREAIGQAHQGMADTAEATARSQAVMKRFSAVLRTMNLLRKGGVGAEGPLR